MELQSGEGVPVEGKLQRDMSTDERRRFWESVDEAAARRREYDEFVRRTRRASEQPTDVDADDG